MEEQLKLAWLAGIIDGEGCIYIARRKPSKTNGTTNFSYVLGLKVAMGHFPTVELVHQISGVGSLHKIQHPTGPRGRANPVRSWMAVSKNALSVIVRVRPYLVTKADEADLAIEFMSIPNTPFGDGNRTSPETLALRYSAWDRMRRLKPTFDFKERHKGD